MSHSFTYETGYKIFDENGNVRASSEDKERAETHGTVEVEILDKDKETVVQNCKQPFKSFVKGFLMDLVLGYRVSKREVGFGTAPHVFSTGRIATSGSARGESPAASVRYVTNTYIDAVGFVNKLSPLTSVVSQIYLNSCTKTANTISIRLSSIQQIDSTASSGTIREIGLFSDNTNDYPAGTPQFHTLIAKDVLATPLTYYPNQYVRINYDIEIPCSSQKVITKNWIYNWLQNLTDPFSGVFKTTSGTPAVGINGISTPTFTKADNMNGDQTDDGAGIVVGTDDGTLLPLDWDNYQLGSLILSGATSGTLSYHASSIPSEEPDVSFTEGTARVTFFRHFTNDSGADITIKEAGIVAHTTYDDHAAEGIDTEGSYLLARWLTGDITVRPNETLVVYWQPAIQADSTTASGKSLNMNNIIVLRNELRKKYKGLRNITMIQKNPQSNINWGSAKASAANLKDVDGYGGFTDWRLPIQSDSVGSDAENRELKVIYNYKNEILYGWNPFTTTVCWSDNQINSDYVYVISPSGSISQSFKNETGYCFCVR